MLKIIKIKPVWLKAIIFVLCFTYSTVIPSYSQIVTNKIIDEQLNSIGVDEKLGSYLDTSVKFATADGDTVTLAKLLSKNKPVIINPVYYECPMLCGVVLQGLFTSINKIDWQAGDEFTIITISINPTEKTDLAKREKTAYLDSLNYNMKTDGWYFLTGNEENIQKLTESFGFNYYYDERVEQYMHAASIVIASPDGKVSRYLYGIEYDAIQLKKALSEAIDGKIGNTVDRILLYCYAYDANLNSYVPQALNIMKIGGLLIVISLSIFLGVLWIKEKYSQTSKNHLYG